MTSMAAKYILTALAGAFLAAALAGLARGRAPAQTRTWLHVAVIFSAVSAWLFWQR
jgi:hypothetical protein